MKYYSEKLNKLFDDAAALKKAEELADKEAAEKENTKKDLATKIEVAEAAVEKAYHDYVEAKAVAEKIAKDANAEITKILQAARKDIAEADAKRTEAIKQFNDKFGTYKAVYTGDRAEREAKRVKNLIEDIFAWNPFLF